MAPADAQEKDWAKEGSATTCSVVDGVLAEARYGNSWCVSTVLKVGANDVDVRWHHEASEAAVTFDEVRPKDRDTINVGWVAAVALLADDGKQGFCLRHRRCRAVQELSAAQQSVGFAFMVSGA